VNQSLKEEIKAYLEAALRKFWADSSRTVSGSDLKELRPFQYRLSPSAYTHMSSVSKHSYDTRSGNWWKDIAFMVAKKSHIEAIREFRITADMSPAAESVINEILIELDNHTRKPSREQDISQTLSAQFTAGQPRSEQVDLYVKRSDGTELFFEMKTPEPNSRDSRDIKRMILYVSAMKKGSSAEAYGSCAYNPSGDGNPYEPALKFVTQYNEIHHDFLVGRDFWEKVGGSETYDELLGICDDVGSISDGLFDDFLKGLDRQGKLI
jgi:hypothetical protein